MKIEEGKFYKMRCGGVVGPMEPDMTGTGHVWFGGFCWNDNGRYIVTIESIFDLIEEVPDPSITNALAQKWREMHQPDHFPDAGKMVFDRDAFRRETAVKVFLHLCQKMHPEETWGDVAECALNAADALLEELGE